MGRALLTYGQSLHGHGFCGHALGNDASCHDAAFEADAAARVLSEFAFVHATWVYVVCSATLFHHAFTCVHGIALALNRLVASQMQWPHLSRESTTNSQALVLVKPLGTVGAWQRVNMWWVRHFVAATAAECTHVCSGCCVLCQTQ